MCVCGVVCVRVCVNVWVSVGVGVFSADKVQKIISQKYLVT